MSLFSIAALLAVIPALAGLYYLSLCVRTFIGGRPCFLSSRVHLSLIALPVMVMMGIALWKIVVVPGLAPEKGFLGFMLLMLAACWAVIWRRGNWHYIFGVRTEAFFPALRQILKDLGAAFEEQAPAQTGDGENAVFFKLEGRTSRLRVSAYPGQNLIQFGALPPDKVLTGGLAASLKARDGLGLDRSVPGFLAAACLLMGMAGYWTFTQVHAMDGAWLTEKGREYFQMGRHAAAVGALDRALNSAPGAVNALRWRGAALAKLGREAEALADWEKALDLDPGNSDIMAHMARLLAASEDAGGREKARLLADKAASLASASIFCLDSQAWVLASTGRFEDAARIQAEVVDRLRRQNASRELLGEVAARLEAYRAGRLPPES